MAETVTARRRSFTKNTANYMSLGTGGLGTLLNGLAAFSVHAKIRYRSLSGGINDNNILTAIANGTTVGLAFSLDGTVNRMRVSTRSVSTDGRQALTGTSNLSAETDYYLQVTVNVGAPALALYLNGALDNSSTPTYGNATWTLGTPTDNDAVGGFKGPPTATADQFDGLIGAIAVWNIILTGGNLTSLGTGTDPVEVATPNLIWYFKNNGLASPEVATTGSLNGTITGDVPIYPPIERGTRGVRWAA